MEQPFKRGRSVGAARGVVWALTMALGLGAGTANAVDVRTAPHGDLNGDLAVTVADLQCLVRVRDAWAEFHGSGGVTHACTTDGAACAEPSTVCRRGFSDELLCLPSCLASSVTLGDPAPGTCPDEAALPAGVDPAAGCFGPVWSRRADMNCDGAIESTDFDFLVSLLLGHAPDLDGDGALNFCDPDSDGDGSLDVEDCAPLDPDVFPGAPDLCDGRFNGCPPGGPIDANPSPEDPSCSAYFGPLIDGVGPLVLVVGGDFIVSGRYFDLEASLLTVGEVEQPHNVQDPTLIVSKVVEGTPTGSHPLTVRTPQGASSVTVLVVGQPIVTSLDPTAVNAGGELTIHGTNLGGGAATIGGLPASVITSAHTALVVRLHPDTPAGFQNVIVTTPAGQASAGQVDVLAPIPWVAGVTPQPAFVDEPLTIAGKHLDGAVVSVAGFPAAILSTSPDELVVQLSASTPIGFQLLMAVTNTAGSAQYLVDVSDISLEPPVIDLVQPDPLVRGGTATVSGEHLKGAVVRIGGKLQPVSKNWSTEQTFQVASDTPIGEQILEIQTVIGTAVTPVVVAYPGPEIYQVSPNPVALGEALTVDGANLNAFDSVTLGGVSQYVFTKLTASQLVFQVLDVTTTGPDQILRIVTPGGEATALVEVLPGQPKPPDLSEVSPSSAARGGLITVLGVHLQGAEFTIGGVPHTPEPGASNLQVQLVVLDSVPAGDQLLVATKPGVGEDSLPFAVLPPAPAEGSIQVSALNAEHSLVLALLPGAVEPGASVLIQTSSGFLTETADQGGALGLVMEGILEADFIRISQQVDGFVSPEVTRTAASPAPGAPGAPHPFLVRVESGAGQVRVAGPAPAFGADDSLAVAFGGGTSASGVAAALHADPAGGLTLVGPPGATAGVFVVDTQGRPSLPLITVPVPYDPPLFFSAPDVTDACFVMLQGSVPHSAAVSLTTWGVDSGGGQITLASPAVAVEDASGTAAGRAVIPPGNLATLAQLVWSGTVGTKPLQIFAAAGNPLTLALASVSVQTAAGQTTVTASGLATTDLLLVGADTGTAAVAVPSDGLAQVSLGGAPTAVYVFTVSLADGRASPCHVIAVP